MRNPFPWPDEFLDGWTSASISPPDGAKVEVWNGGEPTSATFNAGEYLNAKGRKVRKVLMWREE